LKKERLKMRSKLTNVLKFELSGGKMKHGIIFLIITSIKTIGFSQDIVETKWEKVSCTL